MKMMNKIIMLLLMLININVYSQDTTYQIQTQTQIQPLDYYQVDLKLDNGFAYKMKKMDTEYIIIGTFLTTLAIMNAETLMKQGRDKEAIATTIALGSVGLTVDIIGIRNLIKKHNRKHKKRHIRYGII